MRIIGILLAAGFGTRLRPYTEQLPKPLIPTAGLEPLFYNIFRFYKAGIRHIIINTYYLPEKIELAVQGWRPLFNDLSIDIVHEKGEILGTGGGLVNIIQKNRSFFDNSAALVANADTVSNFPLEPLLNNSGTCHIAASFEKKHLEKFKPFWHKNSFYVGVGKEPPIGGAHPAHMLGTHYLNVEAIQKIMDPTIFEINSVDLFSGIYRPLNSFGLSIHVQNVLANKDRTFWYDLGDKESVLSAQRDLLANIQVYNDWKEALFVRWPNLLEVGPNIFSTNPLWSNQDVLSRLKGPLISCGRSAIPQSSIGPNLFIYSEKDLPLAEGWNDAIIWSTNRAPTGNPSHDIFLAVD